MRPETLSLVGDVTANVVPLLAIVALAGRTLLRGDRHSLTSRTAFEWTAGAGIVGLLVALLVLELMAPHWGRLSDGQMAHIVGESLEGTIVAALGTAFGCWLRRRQSAGEERPTPSALE